METLPIVIKCACKMTPKSCKTGLLARDILQQWLELPWDAIVSPTLIPQNSSLGGNAHYLCSGIPTNVVAFQETWCSNLYGWRKKI